MKILFKLLIICLSVQFLQSAEQVMTRTARPLQDLCLHNALTHPHPGLLSQVRFEDYKQYAKDNNLSTEVLNLLGHTYRKLHQDEPMLVAIAYAYSLVIKFSNEERIISSIFTNNGTKLFICSNKSVKIIDPNIGVIIKNINIDDGEKSYRFARLSPDGNRLLICSEKSLILIDTNTNDIVFQITPIDDDRHDYIINAELSSDGSNILILTNNSIKIINPADGKSTQISDKFAPFKMICNNILTIWSDKFVKFFDFDGNLLHSISASDKESIRGLVFNSTNNRLVICSNKFIKIIDLNNNALIQTIANDADRYLDILYSNDVTRLIVLYQTGTIKIINAVNGTLINRIDLNKELSHDGPSNWKISPDGTRLIINFFEDNDEEDQKIALIDSFNGNLIKMIDGTGQFNQDGTKVIINDKNNLLIVKSIDGTNILDLKSVVDEKEFDLHLNPDGSKLVLRSGNKLHLRNAVDGTIIGLVMGPVNAESFNPDGTRLVTEFYNEAQIINVEILDNIDSLTYDQLKLIKYLYNNIDFDDIFLDIEQLEAFYSLPIFIQNSIKSSYNLVLPSGQAHILEDDEMII